MMHISDRIEQSKNKIVLIRMRLRSRISQLGGNYLRSKVVRSWLARQDELINDYYILCKNNGVAIDFSVLCDTITVSRLQSLKYIRR